MSAVRMPVAMPGAACGSSARPALLGSSGLSVERGLISFRPKSCGRRSGSVRIRGRRSRIACSVSDGEVSKSAGAPKGSVFGQEQDFGVPHSLVKDLPAASRYVACTVIVAGALAAGYAVGARTKGTTLASVGGAVALGTLGGATAYALNASAPHVAAVELHNFLVNHPDPESLKREEVDAIAKKFGVNTNDERFISELRDLYDRYITDIIPPGNEDLRGDEADHIIRFKSALGLEDPEAATVHIEIGRRIFRQRMETGDREQAVEERRTFQKLVYVSALVFGEASKFLLPWKRVFKVTDSQVEVAVRDNAQRLFQKKLDVLGGSVDAGEIAELRRAQLKAKLTDEVAAELFRDHTRKQLEVYIGQALEVLKSRSRIKDTGKIISTLDEMLAYNAALAALSSQSDKSSLCPGVGPASILGGQFETDRLMDDLKQLYRTYLTESFSGGSLAPEKVEALSHLKNVFGMGNREAEDILLEVTVKVYRRKLAQAVSGGELDAAPSKAAFLQRLCEELQFDPRKAGEVHEEIYKQKLEQCLADGSLSDADVASLLRLRVLLCIQQQTVDAAHEAICGRLFTKIVDDAIGAGVDGYDADMKNAVRSGVTGLRLTQESAMAIASKAIRAVFKTYVKRSKTAGNRVEQARELKKMVIFSNLVVSELIADIRGDSPVEAPKEEPKPTPEDDLDELEMLQTLKKTKPDAELEARMGNKSQSEITLKDDLELRERSDLYRTYLLYCLSGETTGMPMGTQIVTQRDSSEFVRLGQLGTILGLSQMEVAEVHKGLAEQAFKQQAQVILADGQLNKGRMEQLTELQKQLGLPAESAQKVIKTITSTRMAGAIESAVNQGRLTVEEVKELKEAGVDVDNMISKDVREKLFKKIVDGVFSAGTGDFTESDIYEKFPAELNLDTVKAKKIVETLAKERLTNSLIQAVSLLRQKNPSGSVASLNNLLACDKAVPSPPLKWAVQEELLDLFCLYVKDEKASDEKAGRLQELLGIDDATAQKLKEEVQEGGFSSFGVEEEEYAF
ncbi:hypothetical protein MPTK1_1g27360 [Marchantia polymorpha subsp. ruderalis]|uniref:Uncharacterized protein n=2 Tax=Marchantia polymorpha TaxID=3197 RepID=A0A176VYW6_MARPO|nr:hypothetical protein AXG93_1712s1150 [Marchantia polymorpha subsp. ruderalis]PTQ49667.1 hypothetical protein MARPO_0002s0142 [Marchantia polymorpha]BBN00217.1 hypothetical protein Mp_1g27360 [Marchantia polymorpha subsp. ruderalis]|eukprot:PTQ49667.1 hypothetical protein MARPO_0002s0142 [Marchantia polymorpha]